MFRDLGHRIEALPFDPIPRCLPPCHYMEVGVVALVIFVQATASKAGLKACSGNVAYHTAVPTEMQPRRKFETGSFLSTILGLAVRIGLRLPGEA